MIDTIKWRYSIPLGNGVVTPGELTSEQINIKLKGLHLPDDFEGKSVLDIGAWDGFYSFECEKRNAGRILAIDDPVWSKPDGKAGFDYARSVLGSEVGSMNLSVYDLLPEIHGTFDITLFLGIIYHLKHPLLGLEKIAAMTKELLIVESYCIESDEPIMKFHANVPNTDKAFDPSNYWEPSILAIKEMLKEVGFTNLNDFGGEYQPKRVTIHALRREDL